MEKLVLNALTIRRNGLWASYCNQAGLFRCEIQLGIDFVPLVFNMEAFMLYYELDSEELRTYLKKTYPNERIEIKLYKSINEPVWENDFEDLDGYIDEDEDEETEFDTAEYEQQKLNEYSDYFEDWLAAGCPPDGGYEENERTEINQSNPTN